MEDCIDCDSPVERSCQARLVRVPIVDAGEGEGGREERGVMRNAFAAADGVCPVCDLPYAEGSAVLVQDGLVWHRHCKRPERTRSQ